MFIVFVFTTNLILSTRHDFFYSIHFEKLSLWNRWLIKKIILIQVKLSLTTTIKREYIGPVWDKLFPDHWLCFCPILLSFVDHLRLLLKNSLFKSLWRINCLGWKFVHCGRIHFTLTKIMNKLIATKNRVFISLVGPSETGKSQFLYNWLEIGTFQPKFDKIYFFYQHSRPLYDVMQKDIETFEFVRGVNFEFIDSLKNNGAKYLLIFDDSCEVMCNSKAFVDIATAGRHRVWAQSTLNTTFFTRAN